MNDLLNDEMTFYKNKLIDKILNLTDTSPKLTRIDGLTLYKSTEVTDSCACVYEPSLCFVVQGAKRVTLAEHEFIYDAKNYLISSLHLPGFVNILEASPDRPYLGFVLKIQPREITDLLIESAYPDKKSSMSGMATEMVTPQLLSAFHRLLDLQEHPEDIETLLPMIRKEILYRVLISPQGERLKQIVTNGSTSQQIAQAVDWLKNNFQEPLIVAELAKQLNMSISSFHHHFKTMTAITPLQFQKQLRLQEARRLMFETRLDATTASFQVGYESPSQFSREYSRLYGVSPVKDIVRMRQA